MSHGMSFAMFLSMVAWLAEASEASQHQIPEHERPFTGQDLPPDTLYVEVDIDLTRFNIPTIRLNALGIEYLEMTAPERPEPPSEEVVSAMAAALEEKVLAYLRHGWAKPVRKAFSLDANPDDAANNLWSFGSTCAALVESIADINIDGKRLLSILPPSSSDRSPHRIRLTDAGRMAWRRVRGYPRRYARLASALSKPNEPKVSQAQAA